MRPAPGVGPLAALLFGACRPACEDLDQVPILTEAAPDPVAWQAEIAGTLSDFLAWSGEGTCLSAVSVGLPSAIQRDPRSEGAFDRWQRRIHLASDLDLQAVAPVLQHELCHAWDASRGFVSDEHPDLFPAEQLPAAYPAATHRQGPAAREVFAFLCGVGPVDPALVRSLDAGGCDAGFTPGWRFVLDQVYPEAPAGEPAALGASMPAAIRQVAIADPPAQRIYDVAFVGDGLWILSLEHPPPTWELSRLDLLTGEWTTHRPLPATDPLPSAFLVAGPEEGRLVARWGELWTAFRLPPDGGLASLADSAGAPPSFESGALWWQGRLWQLVGNGLMETDPIDGSRRVHPFPEGLMGLSNRSLHPRSGGLGFVGTVGGHAVQGFWNGGGTWSHAAAPTRRPLAELADGRLVGGGDLRGLGLPALALRGWTRPEAELLALIDPEAGAYWLGGCFDPALAPSDAGDLGAWVSSDGVIWLLGEGPEGLSLLAITPAGRSDRDRRADRLNVGGRRP